MDGLDVILCGLAIIRCRIEEGLFRLTEGFFVIGIAVGRLVFIVSSFTVFVGICVRL
jgi:uncharacterized membrane protein